MSSRYLFAGIDPKVYAAVREAVLARGAAEPERVLRPTDLTASLIQGVAAVFVDGPDLRVRRVFEELDAAGAHVQVIWIASLLDEKRAAAALRERAAAVWRWPQGDGTWLLPGEVADPSLPETRIVMASGISEDETERLAYLEANPFAAKGTAQRFDRLARWLGDYLGVDEAMVNLIGRQLKYVKGTTGRRQISLEMPREHTICQFVVAGNQPVVVPDIAKSAFCQEHGITSAVGAYMGVPLRNEHDLPLGSLCVLGAQARTFSLTELAVLNAVAQAAVDALHQKERDSARLFVLGPAFEQWVQALIPHGAGKRPITLASLPIKATQAAWDQGLAFITVTDSWECLACLPDMAATEAERYLKEVLAAADVSGEPVIVSAQPGQTWIDLRNALRVAVREREQLLSGAV